VLAGLAGAVFGSLATGVSRRGALQDAKVRLEKERADTERVIARLKRELDESEYRSRENAEVFQILPDLVRQMFAVGGRRGVGPLTLKLVEQVLRPEQCAIFIARPAQKRLALAVGHNLPLSVKAGLELEYGQGRIGYVAENRLAMDEADFRNATAIVKRQIEATAIKELRADVVAPIEDGDTVLGVLSVGGPRARPGEEKRLLKMIADLTAVALTLVTHMRSTEETANVDGLTGTYNKRFFQKRLGDELHKAEQEQYPVSLLLLDIDHFKNYNDRNGHLEGDEVLKKVGQILKGSVREDDIAARYGGEEFVVLFPGAPKDLALRLAEGLRRAIEAHPFPHAARQPEGALTISGGVATFPQDSRNGVDLIRCADQALYDAKAAGRNKILAASPNYLT
jgi:diguanylate cyclase (GGDEF)-like protein